MTNRRLSRSKQRPIRSDTALLPWLQNYSDVHSSFLHTLCSYGYWKTSPLATSTVVNRA